MDELAAAVKQVRVQRSVAKKRRIVERPLEPGASVARVAQEHGVNPNVLFYWRLEYREGRFAESGLLPVVTSGGEQPGGDAVRGAPASVRIEQPIACLDGLQQPSVASQGMGKPSELLQGTWTS